MALFENHCRRLRRCCEDFFWDALLFSQNATMMNSDESKIAFDGPEGLKALEIIKRIGESGRFS